MDRAAGRDTQAQRDSAHTKYTPLTARDLDAIGAEKGLDAETRHEMGVVSTVLPFKTNRYVIDHLIDWERVPEDPVYQITFPQRGHARAR